MGTNYYVAKDKCECCKRYDTVYHIGKSSYGWAFSFRGYKEGKLITWKAWKEFLKEQLIVDEYGDFIEYEKFVTMIETVKSPGFTREDGHVNLLHNAQGKIERYYNEQYDWDDDIGYSFCSREFS